MRRLVGRVRAQEVLSAASRALVRVASWRLRRPNRETRLLEAWCFAGPGAVDRRERVDVSHIHGRCAGGQLALRECVQLRAVESVAIPRIGVRSDVEAVRVRTDVWVVTEARAGVGRDREGPIVRDV